jgi:hypothetical protein
MNRDNILFLLFSFLAAALTIYVLLFFLTKATAPIHLDYRDNGQTIKAKLQQPIILEMDFIGGETFESVNYDRRLFKADHYLSPSGDHGTVADIFRFVPKKSGLSSITIVSNTNNEAFLINTNVN